MLFIKFLSVGCADGIHIRYYGIDAKWHNVLIDGGRNSTYHSKVKPVLEEIANNKELIAMSFSGLHLGLHGEGKTTEKTQKKQLLFTVTA